MVAPKSPDWSPNSHWCHQEIQDKHDTKDDRNDEHWAGITTQRFQTSFSDSIAQTHVRRNGTNGHAGCNEKEHFKVNLFNGLLGCTIDERQEKREWNQRKAIVQIKTSKVDREAVQE